MQLLEILKSVNNKKRNRVLNLKNRDRASNKNWV
jgi:hypothetical protein